MLNPMRLNRRGLSELGVDGGLATEMTRASGVMTWVCSPSSL